MGLCWLWGLFVFFLVWAQRPRQWFWSYGPLALTGLRGACGLLSFSGTLLVVSILDIVYDYHLRLLFQSWRGYVPKVLSANPTKWPNTLKQFVGKSHTNDHFVGLALKGLNHAPITIDMDISEKKKRSRKVIWFNPPFSLNVKANVQKMSLKLVKRHFPNENLEHKIFSKKPLTPSGRQRRLQMAITDYA